MKNNIAVKDILGYISVEKLDYFAQETLVDWNVKKLHGKELFKLCVFRVLNFNRFIIQHNTAPQSS